MFQSYEDSSNARASAGRINSLRKELVKRGVDGFIVPRADEFQGEYVAAYAERLRWLTGFAGSAGYAIIALQSAAIFVDGRYMLQVREQTDADILTPHHVVDEPASDWIAENFGTTDILAYDPWLLTPQQVAKFQTACKKAGAKLQALASNPIDTIWQDQPAPPAASVISQPTQFAGRTAEEKLKEISGVLKTLDAGAALLTLPDSVAWLFNLRGSDVAHTPIVHAFAIVYQDECAELFIAPEKVTDDIAEALRGVANLRTRSELTEALQALGAAKTRVMIDPAWAPQKAVSVLEEAGAELVKSTDPCVLPKACKNAAELEGARTAHRRDGAAMVRFLAWLEREAPAGRLDEIEAAKKLEAFRAETGELRDISFDTISGAGPHAALPHYRVTTATNRALEPNSIYLVDSGGQYQDGTTDITRTVIVGTPSDEMKDRFTRVLKGMVNLSRIRFPEGTTGGHLDVLARQALWVAGLDFDHGTGHGVGSYLSVHEGPARFSKADATKLQAGMILSNEPGYYKQGHYGIRIENLVIVREAEDIEGGERPMHWLETLTLCPIDRRLIDVELLSDGERAWLDAYHARVLKEIGPEVDGKDLEWLKQATAPLGE